MLFTAHTTKVAELRMDGVMGSIFASNFWDRKQNFDIVVVEKKKSLKVRGFLVREINALLYVWKGAPDAYKYLTPQPFHFLG